MSILTKKEKEEIISRSTYWNEVARRENSSTILWTELNKIARTLGVRILWILEDYSKKEK